MDRVYVDDRVERRHPDVSKADAAHAWLHAVASAPRLGKDPDEYLAIGPDETGRMLEVVAIRGTEGDWLIYHAQTPPKESAKRELGLAPTGRRRGWRKS